jgi:Epoxide hydrolase N terminus
MAPTVRPFKIDVDDETLNWINDRVKTTRVIPDLQHTPGNAWEDGTPSKDIEELKKYWVEEYDWRKVEKNLNDTYNMFKVELEEGDEVIDLHFVHQRSAKSNAIPLLFAHGWPGNFTEVRLAMSLSRATC